MSSKVLEIVADAMDELGIAYGFYEYAGDPFVYPYFEGEYSETQPITEDGLQESTFILMGYSRDTWMTLEIAKEKIESYFGSVSAKTVIASNGNGIAISYGNSIIVPTGDAEMKRIQITLLVKEWKVHNT